MTKLLLFLLQLFAASLSLAPIIAFLILVIDVRVDAKRMLWLYRRPVAHIAQDIGRIVYLLRQRKNVNVESFSSQPIKQC